MDRIMDQLYGRERILREIVAGVLATPQAASFSLVGAKLVGKSRLLDHLAAEDGPLHGDDWIDWRPYAFQDGSRVISLKIDCAWRDAQAGFLSFVADRLEQQLREVERIPLDWAAIEQQPGASRRLWQMSRRLNQMGYRLVLLMDNFDTVFADQLLTPDSVDELRPLTRELALVVATEQPLHDLDRELAASPLFNVMTQLIIGLLEPESARRWLADYAAAYPALAPLRDEFLTLTGGHPFLMRRIGDIMMELQCMPGAGQALGTELLPLLRLRLAEHGRLLFVTFWRNLQEPPHRIDKRILLTLLKQLIQDHVPLVQTARDHIPSLNWLINQGMVVYDEQGYRLFSPLFAEFIANRLGGVTSGAPAARPLPSADESAVFSQLTKTEGALLRYFQQHSNEVVSPEQLLADVWKRPDASPRRVQEAIRRLRLQLELAMPPVGSIENERGRGYRFVPALP